MKNEKTSKQVSSKAATLLLELNENIHTVEVIIQELGHIKKVLRTAKSVAASALTQSPDKKEK